MLSADQIAKHDNRQSCWIVIEGHAYDVTDFLDDHPGGPDIILRYAGKDATDEYAPIHAPGTIEKELPKSKHLGQVDVSTFPKDVPTNTPAHRSATSSGVIPIEMCINLEDFGTAAKKVLSERAWVYYSSGAVQSYENNLGDWTRVIFRPRVLRDVKRLNMRREILGFDSSLPFFIAPAAMARLGHPDGELCLVRGAAQHHIPYCSSNSSSVAHEELMNCLQHEQAGGTLFFQLYVKKMKEDTIQHIRHARALGFKALVVTVDCAVTGIREEDDRYRIRHAFERGEKFVPFWGSRPPPGKDDMYVLRGSHSSTFNWDDLEWIKKEWGNAGPISIKGIMTVEDAKIACEMGFSSIYISNHGGRQMEASPSSLHVLLELRKFYPEIFDKCEILLDGGVRRARDILIALCLGVRAVGLGRPFMYALSAYGTEGVLKAIQLLSDELETGMRLLGVTSLDQLRPEMVNTRDLDRSIAVDIPGFTKPTPKL